MGGSGIRPMCAVPDQSRKWVISGYQAEVQNRTGKTGFLYHEKGRGWLVDVGDFMEISRDGKKAVVGETGNRESIIKAPYHTNKEWNAYHFIARGNHVIHYLGGYQTIELIDYHVDEKKPLKASDKRDVPGDVFEKCDNCGEILYGERVAANLNVCTQCGNHFRISADAYIDLLIDHDSFEEVDADLRIADPLGFTDLKAYPDRIAPA